MTEDGTLSCVPHIQVRGPVGDEHPMCQLRDILDRVGDKWSVLVMNLLAAGPRRYSELHRAIDGISQRMLTVTLRSLERDGLVHRTVTPSSPPRVDYTLTAVGETLCAPVRALIQWADEHRDYVTKSRLHFDAAEPTG
ncbi:helix-turn-helix transcriptional regulator [Frankia sp. CNm7]|uniref:Helix-turn-helix transcriptional regulator n=1 Tax=Frankia nepalensis TaxID=1836974 RepID=A0A937R5E8_9ACTN|nr:helix-turn-helix domain-containing protein [Frankia nepalensis]MBL7499001.1 helix-turn-helix transcriptional regulator [Frankia nepalensis]MBL7516032.1 helix-turn-helix transcriptional regulator [Frankia nepalensis]MBL7518061.1 helix-turn-helix transcriptional regulator [Frankia nepalensis]MBL7626073.1 helix-turn-helix transcriptional regulator [Frankia nepalensis]